MKFRNDFIRIIENLLHSHDGDKKFEVLIFNDYYSPKVNNKTAEKFLIKSKSSFLLWGIVRTRKGTNNEDKYVVNLDGIVRHNPIPKQVSQMLSSDFSRIFKSQLIVPFTNDFQHFEMYSDIMEKTAMYMIGIAFAISFELKNAMNILETLSNSIKISKEYKGLKRIYSKTISKLKVTLPSNLFNLYSSYSDVIYNRWFVDRNRSDIIYLNNLCDKALRIRPVDERTLVKKAICTFVLTKDVNTSLVYLKRCRKFVDEGFYYCYAFLYAYAKKFSEAKVYYNKAFKNSSADMSVPIQTEQFIMDILAEEPEKFWLYYYIGLINYKAKEDYISAKEAFLNFINKFEEGLGLEKLRDEANKYLKELEVKISNNFTDPAEPPVDDSA